MLQDIRRSRRGQVLVLVALGMVAICGMMALAVDAGQLYFARRFMQNAVDAGALAGAQELVGTNANPTGNPASARYQAMQETFKSLGLTPTNLWTMMHRARLRLRRCLSVNWFESDVK